MLMTRAGYDPDAMVSFMGHLGAYAGEHNSLIDKYLADHPETPKRVAALVGYPELDPKVRTNAQRLAAAIHDQEEARYAIAARQFTTILKTDPTNTVAQYHLGEAQLALGATAKGEQNLTLAAANGSPETKTLATAKILALRASEKRFDLMHPDLQPLRDQLAAAEARRKPRPRRRSSRAATPGAISSKRLESREEQIAYGMPNIAQVRAVTNSRLDTVLRNIATMGRALDTTNTKAQLVLGGVGSVVRNREGGLLKHNAELLAEMDGAAQLVAAAAARALDAALLSAHGRRSRGRRREHGAGRRCRARVACDARSRARRSRHLHPRACKPSASSAATSSRTTTRQLEREMTKAVDSLNRAAVAASQAAQLFDMARADQLEVGI